MMQDALLYLHTERNFERAGFSSEIVDLKLFMLTLVERRYVLKIFSMTKDCDTGSHFMVYIYNLE